MARPLTILTFGWHLGYLTALAHLPHRFDLVPRLACDLDEPWVLSRLLPPNVRLISWDWAAESIRQGRYHALVAHHPTDLVADLPRRIRQFVVFHHRPETEEIAGGPAALSECSARSASATRVFASAGDRDRWRLEGVVVPHGLPVSSYPETSRSEHRVLLKRQLPFSTDGVVRDQALASSIAGLPVTATGLGLSRPSRMSHRDDRVWLESLRTHRVFLHTPVGPQPECGTWSLLEAMASGLPVVALSDDRVSALDGGGVRLAAGADAVRTALLELLEDTAQGADLGRRGREWVAGNCAMEPFLAAWENLLA